MTTIKATSKLNLKNKYNLNEIEVDIIKEAVLRKPIEDSILSSLLLNNNFTCCVCLGKKGYTIIIHHIVAYEKTKDNTYENLAVLCPTCHDLAHSKRQLTLHLSESQLRKFKSTWEEKCIYERSLELIQKYKTTFQNQVDEDILEYVIQLSIKKDGEIIKGYFDVIYLSRGNIFLAGEFEHLETDIDQHVEIYYWEVQLGMRASKTRSLKAILHYSSADQISWTCKKDIADVIPSQLTFEKD